MTRTVWHPPAVLLSFLIVAPTRALVHLHLYKRTKRNERGTKMERWQRTGLSLTLLTLIVSPQGGCALWLGKQMEVQEGPYLIGSSIFEFALARFFTGPWTKKKKNEVKTQGLGPDLPCWIVKLPSLCLSFRESTLACINSQWSEWFLFPRHEQKCRPSLVSSCSGSDNKKKTSQRAREVVGLLSWGYVHTR